MFCDNLPLSFGAKSFALVTIPSAVASVSASINISASLPNLRNSFIVSFIPLTDAISCNIYKSK